MLIKNISRVNFFSFRFYRANSLLSFSKHLSTSNSTSQNANSKVFLLDKYSSFTFDELNRLSTKLSSDLLASLNRNDLQGEKIAVLCANNYTYLISILAIWMANGVPLGKTYVSLFYKIKIIHKLI
jgi:acyl-CoA synthetase (AMP-forming)/AMP-acid ligase II